ncbi:MAG: thermonuclease family protein [Candidatus Methylomirabilales bacterium]
MRKSERSRKRVLLFLTILALLITVETLWTLSGGDPKGAWVLVTDVVDGDTVHAGRGWRRTTVRLIGVDTPETVHPDKSVEFYGPEASEFTERSLAGKWVHLEFEPVDQIDVYGRLLAYVFLDDGTLFNRELVRQGYARAYTRFPFQYREEFRLTQAEARDAGRGLWVRKKRDVTSAHPREGKIIGNARSKIYHVPGQAHYGRVSEKNRAYFDTEDEAIRAGYRRAKR